MSVLFLSSFSLYVLSGFVSKERRVFVDCCWESSSYQVYEDPSLHLARVLRWDESFSNCSPRCFSFGRVCFQWNVGLLECWRTWGWRCGCLEHSTLKLVIIWWWWWRWFLNYWNTLELIIRCLNSDTSNFDFDHFVMMMMMIIWWLRPRWTRLAFLSAIFPRLERVFPSSFSWLPCKFKRLETASI